MASMVKKMVKGHACYCLVESGRVNGKPRIVRQQYLGALENISAAVAAKNNALPEPEFSVVLGFGAVCALFHINSSGNLRSGGTSQLAGGRVPPGPPGMSWFWSPWLKLNTPPPDEITKSSLWSSPLK